MALIDKLKNIANAIRSKTNKTEELTLEQMASEVSDINTLQGLDLGLLQWTNIDIEAFNNKINNSILYAYGYAKSKMQSTTNWNRLFNFDLSLVFLPNVDMSQVEQAEYMFQGSTVQYIQKKWEMPNAKSVRGMFSASKIEGDLEFYFNPDRMVTIGNMFQETRLPTSIKIYGAKNNTTLSYCVYGMNFLSFFYIDSVESVTNFNTAFSTSVYVNTTFRINKWKQVDITFPKSTGADIQSVKYLIFFAIDGSDGATSKTLKLYQSLFDSWVEIMNYKPTLDDCDFLEVEDYDRYGNMTWQEIANSKLINIGV